MVEEGFTKIRRIWLCACLLVCACIFSACGESEEEKPAPDASVLAEKLMAELTFDDSMDSVSQDRAVGYYGIDSADVKSCSVYMSTGATAEEVAVFEATSESGAVAIKDKLTERRNSQIQTYVQYKPSETSRLEEAVLYTQGCFVVYVVSGDSVTAEEIAEGYLGQ